MDPSHMKAQGVEDWLKHWFKAQNQGKRPLTLRDPKDAAEKESTLHSAAVKGGSKGKGKEKARDTPEPSVDDDSDAEDSDGNPDTDDKDADSGSDPGTNNTASHQDDDDEIDNGEKTLGLPLPPSSAASSKATRRAFLASLSDDKNYRTLIRLLDAAKVNKHL